MKTLHAIAAGGLAIFVVARAQDSASGGAQGPAKPKSPYQEERDRIERELQGVWEITEYYNPKIVPVLRASGYMFIQDGWLSINAVVTTKDKISDQWIYLFVGSTKRYTITEANRLHLTDLWGFSNQKGELVPDVAGTAEDRILTFIGKPEIGQKLRIARSSDDSMAFARKTPLPKPPATVTSEK